MRGSVCTSVYFIGASVGTLGAAVGAFRAGDGSLVAGHATIGLSAGLILAVLHGIFSGVLIVPQFIELKIGGGRLIRRRLQHGPKQGDDMASEKDFIPRALGNLLGWSRNFDTVLQEIYESVGISHEQAMELHAKNVAWVEAMALTNNGLTRSPGHIADRDQKKEEMIAEVRKLVRIIQSYPGTTDGMRSQLVITVPKAPSPRGVPGTPYDFKSALGAIGQLNLSWKNTDAKGCIYNIERKTAHTGPWESLGSVGKKKFTDNTFPVGAHRVDYRVQAVRSSGASDWGIFNVFVGVSEDHLAMLQSAVVPKAA